MDSGFLKVVGAVVLIAVLLTLGDRVSMPLIGIAVLIFMGYVIWSIARVLWRDSVRAEAALLEARTAQAKQADEARLQADRGEAASLAPRVEEGESAKPSPPAAASPEPVQEDIEDYLWMTGLPGRTRAEALRRKKEARHADGRDRQETDQDEPR